MDYSDVAAVYAVGGAVTAGHLYRNTKRELKSGIKGIVISFLWPVYWLVAFGLLETFRALVVTVVEAISILVRGLADILVVTFYRGGDVLAAFFGSIGRSRTAFIYAYLGIGAITAGIHIFLEWGPASQLTILVKAALWGVFWPAYWIGRAMLA